MSTLDNPLQNIIEFALQENSFQTVMGAVSAGAAEIESVPPELQGFVLLSVLARLRRDRDARNVVIVVPGADTVDSLGRLLDWHGIEFCRFPDWSESEDNFFDKHIARARMRAIKRMYGPGGGVNSAGDTEPTVILCSWSAYVSHIPNRELFRMNTLQLRTGCHFRMDTLIGYLGRLGYVHSREISAEGEFSRRGEVLDIYPYGESTAVRLTFEFSSLESIAWLYDDAAVHGAAVVITGASEVIHRSASALRAEDTPQQLAALVQTQAGSAGAAQILCAPLLYRKYCPLALQPLGRDSMHIFYHYNLDAYNNFFTNTYQYIHQSFQNSTYRDVHAQVHQSVIADVGDLALAAAPPTPPSPSSTPPASSPPPPVPRRTDVFLTTGGARRDAPIAAHALTFSPASRYYGNIDLALTRLQELQDRGYRLYYASETLECPHQLVPLMENKTPLRSNLEHGVVLNGQKVVLLTAADIHTSSLVHSVVSTTKIDYRPSAEQLPTQLSPGDFVVHTKYGIGQYHGLERLESKQGTRDYFVIEYAEENKIYLPLEHSHLLSRYRGLSGDKNPVLDQIGGTKWNKRREAAKRHIDAYAHQLLRLYALRNSRKGIAFTGGSKWQDMLAKSFPHRETAAQIRAIQEIFADMELPTPMDRLLCGDSGFGKTEVIIRAACKAVHAQRQVAVLVPTTILGEQHFNTFAARTADLPIRVGILTRFTPAKQKREYLHGLQDGSVDIIIGTHALLQPDIRFHALGLLVIDEEHRFGVADKERLKAIKNNIDCLTVSATPIPRSLYRALEQIQPISVIADAPVARKSVITRVAQREDDIITGAIQAELERNGQIYYLHNHIASIEGVYNHIHTLLPDVRICLTHGKMSPLEIETKLRSFINQEYDILLTTTIIESGIDIANVNTILIDRADQLGVSSLYQLRGRVGRSQRQAYAFLLFDPHRIRNKKTIDRLHKIGQYSDFGSGFTLAMHDLEMRGSGQILGRRQSGDIYAVGYELYIKTLRDAIRTLQGQPAHDIEPYLELKYNAYISDDYIASDSTKINLYQQIATVDNLGNLQRIRNESEVRYGDHPAGVRTLFNVAALRILCRELNISMMRQMGDRVILQLEKMAKINHTTMLDFIDQKLAAMHTSRANCLIIPLPKFEDAEAEADADTVDTNTDAPAPAAGADPTDTAPAAPATAVDYLLAILTALAKPNNAA